MTRCVIVGILLLLICSCSNNIATPALCVSFRDGPFVHVNFPDTNNKKDIDEYFE
jgi:hypothetical protein